FFSSRRRHTRWPRDWSSDVCSSDLLRVAGLALTKSTNPATRRWFAEALRRSEAPGAELDAREGLTSRALEAIAAYADTHSPAARPDVMAGLQEFNVSAADIDLMARVYRQARDRFRSEGRNIHHLYEAQRHAMPLR